ncbi:endopeptidase, putative [Plasmodium malariae]|uniref:Endopeptidase, putative n=1 Tax=Plasmodium malariae TaxID=5858 RepID=A0A1C3L0J2_PLAMA|nr:endopeptidase, putative [Plasmodium malariae]
MHSISCSLVVLKCGRSKSKKIFSRRHFLFDIISSKKRGISKIFDKINLKYFVNNEGKHITQENGDRLQNIGTYNTTHIALHNAQNKDISYGTPADLGKCSPNIDLLKDDDVYEIDKILQHVKEKKEKCGNIKEKGEEGYLLELIGITGNGNDIVESSTVCIRSCEDILNKMCKEKDIFKIINMVDTVSNNLCKLGDALELLRNLHNNKSVISRAHEALEKLTSYIDKINIDQSVYKFLKKKYNENANILDHEHREVLRNMILSMENQGVHIKDKKKKKEYLELQYQEKNLSFQASSNFNSEYDGCYIEKNKISPYISEHIIKQYEQTVMHFVKNNKIKMNKQYSMDKYIYLLQDSSLVMTILEKVNDEQVTNQVYALLKKPNKLFLNNILVLQYYRNMLIRFRNFKTYNEYSLIHCILNTPAKVSFFLSNFLDKIIPCFFKELQFIERYINTVACKADNKGGNISKEEIDYSNVVFSTSRNNSSNDKIGCNYSDRMIAKLTPANIFYYMNEIKKVKLKKIEEQMNKHLSLYDVIKFVITLLRDTYSLEMVNIMPLYNELWDDSIIKFEIKKGNYIYGHIYMDLFERENKSHSIAQYTVRCSKNMNTCLKYKWFARNAQQCPYFYSGIVRDHVSRSVTQNVGSNIDSKARNSTENDAGYNAHRNADNVSEEDIHAPNNTLEEEQKDESRNETKRRIVESCDSSTEDGRTVNPSATNNGNSRNSGKCPIHSTSNYRQTTSTFLVCNFNVNLNDTEYGYADMNSTQDTIFVNSKIAYFLEKIKMSIDKVSMFLHEFGHTLHCILSSTYLQHLSGNRSGVDFSEFSSHFFEEYLNSYDALLLLYSKNKEEKDNMKILIHDYIKNKNIICYYSLVQVTIQSIIDQIFYSISHNTNSITERKQLIENEINAYFLGMNYKDIFILDLFPQIHFSKTTHLIHYPSNYYSYLYCSVLAKYVWNRTFKNNIYNKDKAKKIVQFLQGGSVDSSLKNIISLVENDKAKIEHYTQNPHQIPLDDFFQYYEGDNKESKYYTFLQSL